MVKTVEDILDIYEVSLKDVVNVIDNTVTKTIMADLLHGSNASFEKASNVYKAAVMIKRGRMNNGN